MPAGNRQPRPLFLSLCIAITCVTAVAFAPAHAGQRARPAEIARPAAQHSGPRVCGQSILRSPFDYDGATGAYVSGTPGLPTYGTPGTDFPNDTEGVVIPAGTGSYTSYQLDPNAVYYLLPGEHFGGFMANSGDAFVGGYSQGQPTVLDGDYGSAMKWAVDSNSSAGDQSDVTVEYLTVEKFLPPGNSAVINPDSNTGWTISHDTITLNVDGAGVILGAGNKLEDSCLTLNGQYGFQSEDTNSWGQDSLTGGPYDITVTGNEISENDTCDFSGLLTNSEVGWHRVNPVPKADQNSHCRPVKPQGDEGGFKLWHTNGVMVKGNYIHDNWGPGAWVDTDNANTNITGNTFTGNEGQAVFEEISYNFSITDNYMADNGWTNGLADAKFPTAAVYVSESGSDREFGGISNCSDSACFPRSYRSQSVVSGNTLVNNGGSIFLWQDSNRFCSDGFDKTCTLVAGGTRGPFTIAACRAHLPGAAVSLKTYAGIKTGSPREDWWDGCQWRTENVLVTRNTIDFTRKAVRDCNARDWPDCGAGGIFAEYGAPPGHEPHWAVATQLTFHSGDVWSHNTYHGPSTFFGWNQGNGDDPVSWANWTGKVSRGDRCGSPTDRRSGACKGPFGQDAHSAFHG
jgi:parallel beta-helix repeat protein